MVAVACHLPCPVLRCAQCRAYMIPGRHITACNNTTRRLQTADCRPQCVLAGSRCLVWFCCLHALLPLLRWYSELFRQTPATPSLVRPCRRATAGRRTRRDDSIQSHKSLVPRKAYRPSMRPSGRWICIHLPPQLTAQRPSSLAVGGSGILDVANPNPLPAFNTTTSGARRLLSPDE